MTNGKTTLKFSHQPHHALQASIDALTLAIAWLPEDNDIRTDMETSIEELKRIRGRFKTSKVTKAPWA